MSGIFSTNLIDDIKGEIPGFRWTDYFDPRSIEIIKDPGASLEEWIYAVFGLMKDQLGHPFHSIDTTDKSTLLDNISTFTMFYSKEFSTLLDQAKNNLKNVIETQSFGPASAWRISYWLDSIGMGALMERVSNIFVLVKIADRHLSIRRLQRLDETMRQSLQVLTEKDEAIVIDAYNCQSTYAIGKHEMRGLLRSIVRRSAGKHGFVPPSVYIEDVTLSDNHAVSGGGFADVYKGSLASGSVVAMKVLRFFGTSEHPGWRQCFQEMCSEAMLWKTFDHENIIPLLGLADIGTGPTQKVAMVSPWMKDGDLRNYLFKYPRTCRPHMLEGIIKGIEYLHELSPPVVHGDIRCANILMDNYGQPLLSDFGLSRIEAVFSATTGSTYGGGCLRWQAPELLYPSKYGGNGRHTTQSDIYAFAMTCVEVFTDAVPFKGMSDAAVITTVLNDGRPDQPALDASGRELTAEEWKLVAECWHPAGSERPSASDIRETWFEY